MNGDEKLPNGWIKVKSKSRPDKEYFYNSKLKISLWKFEDLQKLQDKLTASNSNGCKKSSSKKSPTKQPSSSATSKTLSSGLSDQSKNIKKNVARDRMAKLQNVLEIEAKRGSHESLTERKNVSSNTEKITKVKVATLLKPAAVVKRNIAAHRLKNLNDSLSEEVKKSRREVSNEKKPSSSHKSKVPIKFTKKDVEINATEISVAEGETDVDMVDISLPDLWPDQSRELPADYEIMDWEDVPEQEVINEVQKIRTTENASQGPSPATSKKIHQLSHHEFFIIVDTNVFLSNIDFLREIKGKMFKDIGKATIFLPYIVLCELDKLKTHEDNVARLARRSITFIDDCFRQKDPFMIGQSAVESLQKQIISVDSGDDEILNCCLQIQEKTKKIILLSNDKNLRNKAFVNKVESFSRDMLNFIDYNIKNELKFE